MPIKAVLFDLDGTLLPMDQDVFITTYFNRIAEHMAPYGYEPKELISAIWSGTAAMIKNDGFMTNEEAFWNACKKVYGDKIIEDIPHFDEFYATKFDTVSEVCGKNPKAAAIVHELKSKGYRVILATNPLFPTVATKSRIRWVGLEPEDFEYFTTYENSSYCKPNLAYYQAILDKSGLDASECLMVGNDVGDDMVTSELGMKVFLLMDCLINKHNTDISAYPNGNIDDLFEFIEALE